MVEFSVTPLDAAVDTVAENSSYASVASGGGSHVSVAKPRSIENVPVERPASTPTKEA